MGGQPTIKALSDQMAALTTKVDDNINNNNANNNNNNNRKNKTGDVNQLGFHVVELVRLLRTRVFQMWRRLICTKNHKILVNLIWNTMSVDITKS